MPKRKYQTPEVMHDAPLAGNKRADFYFDDYEDDDSRRLRKVLKQVSFSGDFTPEALDSMIYMTAPPPKPESTKPLDEQQNRLKQVEPVGVIKDILESADEITFETHWNPSFASRGDQNELEIGGIRFVRVPKGRFVMGSKDDNELALDSERPQHTVEISYDYWITKFIITNQQFAAFIKGTKYETTADKERGFYPKQSKFVKGVNWRHPTDPKEKWEDKADHPVVQVS